MTTLIAGPCAAESEAQLLEVAGALSPLRPIFRAGIWKPRTSPASFQGIGDEGLQWLQAVQARYKLPVATEVCTPEQTVKAIAAGIDYLWIGARTAANPIAVQDIAQTLIQYTHAIDACRLQGIFIKNPVNEDVALWQGNIERLRQTGLPITAIHRGCNHRPCWQMAYQLHKHMPETDILLDPSHMSGDAHFIAALCHKANELNYDGLMVEVHPCPKKALSDSKQQITPNELVAILNECHIAFDTNDNNRCFDELTWLRATMDEVDDELWNLILRRMEVSRQIGAYKKHTQMAVVQPSRFQKILDRRIQWAQKNDLRPEAVSQIMNAIHEESIRVQN